MNCYQFTINSPPVNMSLLVDFEYLINNAGNWVVKELAIMTRDGNRQGCFHFKSPKHMLRTVDYKDESKEESDHGINWNDGFIEYDELKTVLEESVCGGSALYAYNEEKCLFLNKLIKRTFINLESEMDCPLPSELAVKNKSCMFSCHGHPLKKCALRSVRNMVFWLNYNEAHKKTITCPKPPYRHDMKFISNSC